MNFIEFLTHQEQFGAFLISGHRGAGKSSFVEYCLNEYERMAFQRSIRISRGGQFGAIMNLMIIALILTGIYVLLSQFLELAAQNAFEAILAGSRTEIAASDFASSSVLWMIAPFIVGTGLMVVPGYMVLRTASAIAELQDTPWRRTSSFWITFVAMVLIPLSWLFLPSLFPEGFGLSDIKVQALFHGFVWVLIPLMTFAQMVQQICKTGRYTRVFVKRITRYAIFCTALASVISLVIYSNAPPEVGIISEYGFNLVPYALIYVSACLAGVSVFGKTVRPWSVLFYLFILAVTLKLYLFGLAEGSLPPDILNDQAQLRLIALAPLPVFFLGFLFAGYRRRKSNDDGERFDNDQPFAPVKTILLIKANVFILLTVVGLLPAIRVIYGWWLLSNGEEYLTLPSLELTHIGLPAFLTIFATMAIIYRCEYLWICRDQRSFRQDQALGALGRAPAHPNEPDAWASTWKRKEKLQFTDYFLGFKSFYNPFKTKNKVDLSGIAQFTNAREIHTSSPLTLNVRDVTTGLENEFTTVKQACIDADWWRRPPLNIRLAQLSFMRVIARNAERALLEEQYGSSPLSARARHVFRKLEVATLPHWVYSVRHPVLKVWINLGFDNLEHSRIVEAMLRRLRGVYRARFISLTSVIGGMNAMILLFLAVLVTSFASKSIFHIGNISDYTREGGYTYRFEGNTVSSRDTFGATNYCGFFEVYPEIAPVAKSLICALPFANGIIELLYSPVLKIHTDFRSEVPLGRKNLPFETRTEAGTLGCAKLSLSSASDLSTTQPIGYVDWAKCIKRGEDKDLAETFHKMFIGGSTATAGHLVSKSELVLFVLDPNHGLPLINFNTKLGNTPLIGANWNQAFSPYGEGEEGTPTMRIYHLLLYLLVFWLLFTINRRLRVLPYQSNVDAMDELILLINGRETLHSGDQNPRGWLGALWPFKKNERTIETGGDPRVVEQRFIELLNKMRPHQPSYLDGPTNIFEVMPEITFVLDEMDKLSGVVDPELSMDAEGQTQFEENNRERARSLQLHQLLSDMKRLISGHSARFIFIGGRLYHDEWLADQAQRAPILNSIFSGQIYLPSLMADRHHTFGRMNDRITELVVLMYRNARHRYYGWRNLRKAGPFNLTSLSEEPTYVQFKLPYSSHPRRLSALAHLVGMKVVDSDGEYYSIAAGALRRDDMKSASKPSKTSSMSLGEQETFDQFINFLTYRSAGNPKKLKELIQSLMQTSSFAFSLPRYPTQKQSEVRWTKLRSEAHDVITLDDSAIYRMQFIDMLYRHLADHTESRNLKRDDKVSMSIFYLMDFLMKFHNRGFSRTNLQRVDELSHIHRAPDLRSVMSLLVQVSSERFLHRVLNGVYNFRFRSDFAREIDYLSRISKEEMAALNFTLDESQSLKGLYQQTINTGERENIDTISGLGELYEYDQEYEIARNYYRRAIAMLDEVQENSIMSGAQRHTAHRRKLESDAGRSFAEFGMLGDLLVNSDPQTTRKVIGSQIHWVVARLRLMLQVGQTYEQEQNFERASATYMHSARFSNAVLDALALDSQQKRNDDGEDDLDGISLEDAKASEEQNEITNALFKKERALPLVIVRNLSIFYQAGFAAAWVLEKDPENIDDSVVYAEGWIRRLYRREPLLQLPLPNKDDYALAPPFSGNILIQASLAHDRIGDLYFMKGEQSIKALGLSVIIGSVAKPVKDKERNKRRGYLWRAQYNYAMSVWLLRKYLTNRYRIAGKSWSVLDDQTEPFEQGSITSSQFHVTLADALTDLAEVIYAGRSALRLSRELVLTAPENSDYSGSVTLDELHTYRRCLRAFFNHAVSQFAGNLTIGSTAKSDEPRDWLQNRTNVTDRVLHFFPRAKKDGPRGVPHIKKRWDKLSVEFQEHMEKHRIDGGNYSQWVGRRKLSNELFSQDDSPQMNSLEFQAPGTEFQRLMAYKFFSQAAARTQQAIGESTNTSNEFLLQADGLNSALWDAKTLRYLKKSSELGIEAPDGHDLSMVSFFEQLKEANCGACDTDQFHVGLLSLSSILDAIKRIQFSDRPSATRLALNHGNPAHEEGLLSKGNPDRDAARREMQADYDMAQAFRDDPRPITQACSLILALLHEDTGPLCTGLALLAYRDVLLKFSRDTFTPFGEAEDPLLASLTKALKTGKVPKTSYRRKLLCKALFRETYAGLSVTLERYRFPILNRLNGLKILTDALLLQTPEAPRKPNDLPESNQLLNRDDFRKHFGTERNSQIGRYVRELTSTADVYGSDLHFPVERLGHTMAFTFLHMRNYGIHAIYDDMIADPPSEHPETDMEKARAEFYLSDDLSEVDANARPLLNETILTRESVGEMAVNKLNRSQESFSMGDAYYENVGYLNYLNDDFNDRSIHYFHATAMAHADLTEVLALFVKEGFSI